MANPFEREASTPEMLRRASGAADSLGVPAHEDVIHLDAIAKRLLEDNFLLTALELHTELLESGRDLRRLRDFFSNPANFELQQVVRPPNLVLPRTGSTTTFESADFNRSDDGADAESSDRVAVLEFEVRKLEQLNRTLREQLTDASDCAARSSDATPTTRADEGRAPLPQPHERRALNFLVHEFLLANSYKLTSVTFSDEVADQDFEDWDEVGLNVARPGDLFALYREFSRVSPGCVSTCDAACEARLDDGAFDDALVCEADLLNRLNEENKELLQRNGDLSRMVDDLSLDVANLQRQLDARLATSSAIQAVQPPLPEVCAPEPPTRTSNRHMSKSMSTEATLQQTRCVSERFREAVFAAALAHDDAEEVTRLCALDRLPSSMVELVALLADSLPLILPHVLLNKREEAVPLLLATVILVANDSSRDALHQLLFNLHKRPDARTRRLIASSCAVFASHAGAVRTEAELLPQCWQQMEHKHVERRLLVAETCGLLAPLLPAPLVGSLVLSVLLQLVSGDRSDAVRAAALRSLAVVCLVVADADKFSPVCELVLKCLTDASAEVASAARHFLLVPFAVWAEEMGKLQLGVIAPLVRRLADALESQSLSAGHTFESVACTHLACMQSLICVMLWSVLRTDPVEEAVASHDIYWSESRVVAKQFYADDADLVAAVSAFEIHTNAEWFKSSPALDYLVRDMLPLLITLLDRVDVCNAALIRAAVTFLREFCSTLGRGFSNSKIRPLFSPSLNISAIDSEALADASHYSVCRATFPVYCAGVLSAFRSDDDWHDLRRFLRWKLVNMAESALPTVCVAATFLELMNVWDEDRERLLAVVWELVPHRDWRVRRMSAETASALVVALLDSHLLGVRILPALVTLSADNQPSVRVATLTGFVSLLLNCHARLDVLDKVRMQLDALFDDANVDVLTSLVRHITQAAAKLNADVRDEFVLPRLASLAERNNGRSDGAERRRVASALFDAFSAFSCCYLTAAAAAASFAPGLRALLPALDAEHANVAASILRDAEAQLGGTDGRTRRATQGGADSGVDEVRSRVASTLRDIRDKVDQHRDNVPQLFRKRPNS